jgi:hypothetical protein
MPNGYGCRGRIFNKNNNNKYCLYYYYWLMRFVHFNALF